MTQRPTPDSRRGFTIVEAVFASVLGTLVLLLVFSVISVQSQAYAHLESETLVQDALTSTADFVATEVRSVARDGVLVAQADSLVVRQPMVLGMTCAAASSVSYGYLPLDGGGVETSEVAGYGIRAEDGSWSYTAGSWSALDVSFSQTAADSCAQQGADTVGVSGDFVRIGESFSPGTVSMLYREVTLSFAPSLVAPEAHGLYYASTGSSRLEAQPYLLPSTHFEYHRSDTDTYEQSVGSADVQYIDRIRVVVESRIGDRPARSLILTVPLANARS